MSQEMLDALIEMKKEIDAAEVKPRYWIFYDHDIQEFVAQELFNEQGVLQKEPLTQTLDGKG